MNSADQPGPPALECRGIRKTYAAAHEFTLGKIGGLFLSIRRGELFALVGPSGCGKTTTLQIVGGFLAPDAGTVLIDGMDLTKKAPYARPTNTVFQNGALFPHMSVGANIEFGLQMERVSRRERKARIGEVLELVGLAGFQRRRVAELSGGQQQRAALARAIVKRPKLLLLDEPLGALDLKLRRQLQAELVQLKQNTSTTFLHVTHDQEEACAIADRIGVMKNGELVQIDEPDVLFRAPKDTYVASFLDVGTIIRGKTITLGDYVEIAGRSLSVRAPAPMSRTGSPLAAVLPPNKVRLVPPPSALDDTVPTGIVTRITFTGGGFLVDVAVTPELEVRAATPTGGIAGIPGKVAVGRKVGVSWNPEDVILVEDKD